MEQRNLYIGKAGEHAVISQFLARQWQVAVPEVDVGDDILVAQDLAQTLRVQVKTSRAIEQKRSYAGQFRLPISQVATPGTPELLYVFAVFRKHDWSDFVVISRRELADEHALQGAGRRQSQHLALRIRFEGATVRCGSRNWSRFRSNWPASADHHRSISRPAPA